MPQRRDDEMAKAFGRNLAAARKRVGVSQEALAEGSGLSRDAIGKLEKGQRTPRLDTLVALAATLGVDPATLLEGLKP